MSSAATYHCTNPQRIRIDNRQADNRQRESNPDRKAAVKAWCIGKLCTCGCGKPANCAHHPTDDLYGDEWGNLDECEPYTGRCHHMKHKGYDRCPECGGWMKRGSEKCAKCRGWRARNLKKGVVRHPCEDNEGRQVCRTRLVCPYSPQKAENCDYFKKRKPAPVGCGQAIAKKGARA